MQTTALRKELLGFKEFGSATVCSELMLAGGSVPMYENEFWTAKQRAAVNLHEVPYRACFKPQLPRFFVERLTNPGEVVYDPFMGRGTTLVEAALLGRRVAGCDVNPLAATLAGPRLAPPELAEVKERLEGLNLDVEAEADEDLAAFYHPVTLGRIQALRRYLLSHKLDAVDEWIRMVALTRLTGHSAGYFSVYTLPPNQAVMPHHQRRINEKRGQTPEPRDVKALILKKSAQLMKGLPESDIKRLNASEPVLMTGLCHETPMLENGSVSLVVTSPPFLNVVNYKADNWLRCWFLGVDAESVKITQLRKLEDWQVAMTAVFKELARVLKPGGHVAFEVGEVDAGRVRLEEAVVPCGIAAGLEPELILINSQDFTKTSNCWGVDNNAKGTNSNRVVVFRKPA
jgi:SAM-dependent methyltransferase